MNKLKRITLGPTVMGGGKALDSANQGRAIDGDAVHQWLQSWGTDDELPPPRYSKAVQERLRRDQRQKAAAEIDALRDKCSALDDDIDVVEMLRKDRARNDE